MNENELIYIKKNYGIKVMGIGTNQYNEKKICKLGEIKYNEKNEVYVFHKAFFVASIGSITLLTLGNKIKEMDLRLLK